MDLAFTERALSAESRLGKDQPASVRDVDMRGLAVVDMINEQVCDLSGTSKLRPYLATKAKQHILTSIHHELAARG